MNARRSPESIRLLADSGATLYLCSISAKTFDLNRDDAMDDTEDIITVGEFYEMAAGRQTSFT